ncbi:MAG: YceI family protein [Rhodomicrobium sp.]
MKATNLVTAFLLGISAGASHGAIYSFDRKRAEVNFTYYAAFVPQSARFTEMEGVIQFDGAAPERSFVDAVVKTASLTANAWESELKGSSFFNVALFPEIHFTGCSATPTGLNSADFMGNLTMKGITQPITLHAVVAPEQPPPHGDERRARGSRHITATAHINRSAFNITALSFLVEDGIDIEIKATLQEVRKSNGACN